ncbi:MAG TPA: hypothetical protein VHD34_01400, partial [Xanthobacteraceae bacterium]|nr:hypothetical protein [Xanthobacteraceae bacterium]
MNRGDSGAAEIVIVERRGDGSEPRHDPHERDIGAVAAGEEPLEVVLRADEKGTAALALKKRRRPKEQPILRTGEPETRFRAFAQTPKVLRAMQPGCLRRAFCTLFVPICQRILR